MPEHECVNIKARELGETLAERMEQLHPAIMKTEKKPTLASVLRFQSVLGNTATEQDVEGEDWGLSFLSDTDKMHRK